MDDVKVSGVFVGEKLSLADAETKAPCASGICGLGVTRWSRFHNPHGRASNLLKKLERLNDRH